MSSMEKKLDTIILGINKIINQLDFFINFNQNPPTIEEIDEEENMDEEFGKINLKSSQIKRKDKNKN